MSIFINNKIDKKAIYLSKPIFSYKSHHYLFYITTKLFYITITFNKCNYIIELYNR